VLRLGLRVAERFQNVKCSFCNGIFFLKQDGQLGDMVTWRANFRYEFHCTITDFRSGNSKLQ
jgi:hypothetical protein